MFYALDANSTDSAIVEIPFGDMDPKSSKSPSKICIKQYLKICDTATKTVDEHKVVSAQYIVLCRLRLAL